jgi:hypothetical protein
LKALIRCATAGLLALLLSSAPAVLAQDAPPEDLWVAGGGYQLTLTATSVRVHAAPTAPAPVVRAAGGGYVLLLPAEAMGTGTPCCCMHLPCIIR